MATNGNNAAIEEFPIEIQEFPVAETKIEEFPLAADSPEVAAAAQNSATVAQQALDVATLPTKLDWTAANEHLDQQRFADVLDLQKQASELEAKDPNQALNPRSESNRLRTKAFGIQQQMTPETQAAQNAASLEQGQRARSYNNAEAMRNPRPTFEVSPFGDAKTPSEAIGNALSNTLGTGFAATLQPIVDSAGRNVGGATGGALGAALGAAATAGTGGVFPLLYGLAGAFLGSQAGGAAQEGVLSATETPEETAARHQRTAEDIAANPGAAHVGAALATAPFFGPSLAQFGKAAAGDLGARLNILTAGGIGAGMEYVGAKMRGESAKPEDIAAAVFTQLVMNKPTRLGQAIGLHPSSEEALTKEAETKYRELPPLPFEVKGETQGDLTTRAPTSTVDVFANLQKAQQSVRVKHAGAKDVQFEPGREAWFTDSPQVLEVYTNPEHPLHWNRRKGRELPTVTEAVVTGNFFGAKPTDMETLAKSIASKMSATPEERGGFWVEGYGHKSYSRENTAEAAIADESKRAAKRVFNISEGGEIQRVNNWDILNDAGFDAVQTDVEYTPGAKNYVVRNPKQIAKVTEPTTTTENAQQISETSAPDGGVRAPEVPLQDGQVPADESGQGVQPSGQGGSVAENAPEAPREITPPEPPPAPPTEPTPPEPPSPVPAEEAVASEASRAPADLPGATSNKEAVVNAERATRELDPVIKEARIGNADSIDRAQQVIAQNPLKPQEIITRLQENPHERTISLEDSAVLLVERTKLNNTRRELLSRANDEALDPTERAAAKAEFQAVETKLNALDQAAQDARSTWGRFGQLWQRSMRQDFTLEALEQRARLAKGEALTPEESAKVKTIADEVASKQKEADAAVEQAQAAQAAKGVDEAITESAKQPDVEPAVQSLADRIIAKLDEQATAARKRLRAKLQQQLGSITDVSVLSDFTIIAALHRFACGALARSF